MSESEENPAHIYFAVAFPEVSIIYSLLFERSKRLPSREVLMDEIERRELYVNQRAAIPHALDQCEHLEEDMREYLVSLAGEESVQRLEANVMHVISSFKGVPKTP